MSESAFKAMLSGFSEQGNTGNQKASNETAKDTSHEETSNTAELNADLNSGSTRFSSRFSRITRRSAADASRSSIEPVVRPDNTSETTADIKPQSVLHIMYDAYRGFFRDICVLDKDMLLANQAMIKKDIVSFERQVSIESASFIASYFPIILSALILDYNNCRKVMANAIETEINLDSKNAEERAKIRKSLNTGVPEIETTLCVELGLTMFSDELLYTFMETVTNGFRKVMTTQLATDVTAANQKLTEPDCFVISMIASNYVYVIRALNNNNKFFNDMLNIVESLMVKYELEKGWF